MGNILFGLLPGIGKRDAAKFSFLMVLPLIFGKIAKETIDGAFAGTGLSPTVATTDVITSFFVGVFAYTLMVEFVRKGNFASYRAEVDNFGPMYFYLKN